MNYKNYLKDGGVIVQIGAYDGISFENYGLQDLINQGNYDCHLIEPQEDAFETLQNTYANAKSSVRFHNCAIYTEDGEMPFLKQQEYSSFVLPDPAGVMVTVKTKRLKTFFDENTITEISGLFLDVEGVEDELIRQLFDETEVRPDFIRFEYPHLKNLPELEEYIKQQGYIIEQCPYFWCDKICVRADLIS